MVRISGLFRVALSLPLLLLGACTPTPPSSSANVLNNSLSRSSNSFPNSSSSSSPSSSSKASPNPAYQPPLRETPLRTESAGVRLNEEYCIDSSPSPVAAQTRLTQSLPRLILSVQTLLPMPVVPPKTKQTNRNLSCNG